MGDELEPRVQADVEHCPGREDEGAAAALKQGLEHLQVHITQVVMPEVVLYMAVIV